LSLIENLIVINLLNFYKQSDNLKMFPQELNYLNLIVLLTVVTLVLCALIAMCFKIKKLEKKLDYLTNQIKFERHVLQ